MKKIILLIFALLLVSCDSNIQTDAKALIVYPHDYTIEEREILSLLDSGSNTIAYDFEENTLFSKFKCSIVDYNTNEILLSNQYSVESSGSFALSLGLPGDDILLSIMSGSGGKYEYLEENFVDDFEVSYHTQMNETIILNEDEIIIGMIYLRKGEFRGVKSKNTSGADIEFMSDTEAAVDAVSSRLWLTCNLVVDGSVSECFSCTGLAAIKAGLNALSGSIDLTTEGWHGNLSIFLLSIWKAGATQAPHGHFSPEGKRKKKKKFYPKC